MSRGMSRRVFIKTGSVAVASAAIGGSILQKVSSANSQVESYDRMITQYNEGEKAFTYCEMCFWKCGVVAHVRDGVVHKLDGNPLNPNNQGHLCAKGNSGIYLL